MRRHARLLLAGGTVLGAALVATCAPVPPTTMAASVTTPTSTAAALSGAADRARQEEDHARFLDLAQEALSRAPRHPELYYDVARAHALLGNHEAARRTLEQATTFGSAWMAIDEPDFATFWRDPDQGPLRATIERRAQQVGTAVMAFTVPVATVPYPEGVAWDSTSHSLLLGSTHGRSITRIHADGTAEVLVADRDGLGGVLGLAVDPPRHRACAAHAFAPGIRAADPTRVGRTGVACFDLETGVELSSVMIPDDGVPHLLNALVVDRDGSLLATDSLGDRVWRLRDGAFTPVVGSRTDMSYLNGLAIDIDGRRLFVAHLEGLSVVDLTTGAVVRIDDGGRETLAGIDGLVRRSLSNDSETLIAVQPSLRRAIQIQLDSAGRRLERLDVLTAHHPAMNGPTTGAVANTTYYLLANSQLRVRNADRSIPWDRLRDPVLLAIDLDASTASKGSGS